MKLLKNKKCKRFANVHLAIRFIFIITTYKQLRQAIVNMLNETIWWKSLNLLNFLLKRSGDPVNLAKHQQPSSSSPSTKISKKLNIIIWKKRLNFISKWTMKRFNETSSLLEKNYEIKLIRLLYLRMWINYLIWRFVQTIWFLMKCKLLSWFNRFLY
jgi:hypothetical protein